MEEQKVTAMYVRVSTDAQAEEGYSVGEQTERLTAYCQSRDFVPCECYIDGGFSGSNIHRPEMERLIEDCRKGKINRVVVYKLDRLSRSQKDTMYLIEDVFLPLKIDFISINESFDTSTAFGRAMVGILSVFAQLERDNIRMRTRMGMEARVKEGYWMGGGRIPYGYDYDKNLGTLVPNADADSVRKIYDLYIQGYSTYKIANMLGMEYERLPVQILQRKSNAGYIVYKGQEYLGKHEPIISLDTYNKAMEMMQRRSVAPIQTATSYIFSGMVYCGVCGAKMRYQKTSNGKVKLYCYSRQKSKSYLVKNPDCDNDAYWADEVESLVIDDLFKTGYKEGSRLSKGDIYVTHSTDELDNRRKTLEAQIKRLYTTFAGSDDPILLDTLKEMQADLVAVNDMIKKEEGKIAQNIAKQHICKSMVGIQERWPLLADDEKKVIVREVIDRVTLTHGEVEISYRD